MFKVSNEHWQNDVSNVVLMYLLLLLNKFPTLLTSVSLVDFEQPNAGWEAVIHLSCIEQLLWK